jgi:hypothetical protein
MKKICLLAAMVLSAAVMAQSAPATAQAVAQSAPLRSPDHGPILAGQGAYLLPGGYFTTRGAQIVDRKGIPVRIASVGWYGLEGNSALRGLDSINYKKTMDAIVADGFNTIRIPWCDLLLQCSNCVSFSTTIPTTAVVANNQTGFGSIKGRAPMAPTAREMLEQ